MTITFVIAIGFGLAHFRVLDMSAQRMLADIAFLSAAPPCC